MLGGGLPDAEERVYLRARSKAEAEAKAKAHLLSTQRHSVEGSLTVLGDVRLVAANNLALAGWAKLDGRYQVDSATHTVGGGYTVQAKIKRVA